MDLLRRLVLRTLADLEFMYHGSTYYRNDLPWDSVAYGDLLLMALNVLQSQCAI